jgi:hypothetical protein
MNWLTWEQLRRDFHETTRGRYTNLFRLITRITTTWRRR